MAVVYVLYSKELDKYYIGSCLNLEERLRQHKENEFDKSYTKRANDWKVFLKIEALDYKVARKVEKHVKSMKSKKYIENLQKYKEMQLKLIAKYK